MTNVKKIALIEAAIPLSFQEETILSQRLKDIFGHSFKLKVRIDPEIIGGLVIKVGEKVIDLSLLGKLKKLKEYLVG